MSEYQCVNNLKYTFHTHSRQLLGVFCEKQPQDINFTYSIECGSMNWDGHVKLVLFVVVHFSQKSYICVMCSIDIDSILLLSISLHCHENVHMKKMLTVIVVLL